MRRRSAFTLLDTLLSMSLLTLLSLAVFSVFEQGSSLLSLGNTRASLAAELRRVTTMVGRDLLVSSFYTVQEGTPFTMVVPRNETSNMTVNRDSLSFATLSNPASPSSYDSVSGLANWDQYGVYLATREAPDGKLFRFRVARPGTPDSNQTLFGAHNAVVDAFPGGPLLLPNTTRSLTNRLVHFSVVINAADQQVELRIILRGDAGRIQSGKKSLAELLETKIVVRPENTWPRL